MTYSVYQHWDPLKVCVVGRSYPPEFYSWITVPHVRNLFEKIAIETEEDYQGIIRLLEKFGVEVLRPELPLNSFVNGKFNPPPMTPRDYMIMIGETFYENYGFDFLSSYTNVKDSHWPVLSSWEEFGLLPKWIQDECVNHGLPTYDEMLSASFVHDKIFKNIESQGNKIVKFCEPGQSIVNGAMISRIGRDLYFGTEDYNQDVAVLQKIIDQRFTDTRNHIVNTGGHSDATYCPVCPGLIISLRDVPSYVNTYPGWEVVYLPGQGRAKIKPFWDLKMKNKGRWWIPGFEYDQEVIDVVETWMSHWVGYVEETVFDVNMLIIDPKNVAVFNYNKQVFDALDRFGITPHIVPFRHRYFWDGGIHCVTSDLHREGSMQDYFPERSNV